MIEIEIDAEYREGYSKYGDRAYYKHWWPDDNLAEAMEWLDKNVGKWCDSSYSIPFYAKGWMIFKGYNGDERHDDWAWRNLGNLGYKSRGKFGHWLRIDDDELGMHLKLSGLLDSSIWTGECRHKDREVAHIRAQSDPDYPKEWPKLRVW